MKVYRNHEWVEQETAAPLQSRAMATTEVLGEVVREFRTRKVIRIGTDYFDVDENGGYGGAWDTRSGQNGTTTKTIDRTEARRLLLEMGLSLEEVAEKTNAHSD